MSLPMGEAFTGKSLRLQQAAGLSFDKTGEELTDCADWESAVLLNGAVQCSNVVYVQGIAVQCSAVYCSAVFSVLRTLVGQYIALNILNIKQLY